MLDQYHRTQNTVVHIIMFQLMILKRFDWLDIQTSLMFGFLVQHFVKFVFSFSVWFIKMGFNPSQNWLNTGFTITEMGLFYGCKHRKQKFADSWLLLTRWRCLFTSNTGWVLLILNSKTRCWFGEGGCLKSSEMERLLLGWAKSGHPHLRG